MKRSIGESEPGIDLENIRTVVETPTIIDTDGEDVVAAFRSAQEKEKVRQQISDRGEAASARRELKAQMAVIDQGRDDVSVVLERVPEPRPVVLNTPKPKAKGFLRNLLYAPWDALKMIAGVDEPLTITNKETQTSKPVLDLDTPMERTDVPSRLLEPTRTEFVQLPARSRRVERPGVAFNPPLARGAEPIQAASKRAETRLEQTPEQIRQEVAALRQTAERQRRMVEAYEGTDSAQAAIYREEAAALDARADRAEARLKKTA